MNPGGYVDNIQTAGGLRETMQELRKVSIQRLHPHSKTISKGHKANEEWST
ncbi:MAG: hypothetical protein CM15mV19_0310 [uncultured marine virus]|nr:MAG: hypothetical protein CM15mV19_0310 [uncultured marine virus]